MQLSNREFTLHRPPRPAPAVLVVPLGGTHYARLLHANFRCRLQPFAAARETHRHDVYHVIVVSGGRGRFVVGDRLQEARPGLVVLTSPGEPHSFNSVPGEDTEFCEVTFEFRAVDGAALTRPFHEMLAAWVGQPCRPLSCVDASPGLRVDLMREIERIVRVGFAQDRDAGLWINDALGRILLALYAELQRPAPSGPDDALLRVQEHIHRHVERPLGLAQLARLAGVSANYLSRRFKARFGTTPIFYHQRLRAQTAADLLRTTDHPLARIAALAGYADVFAFSRLFKRWVGSPPGAYRRTSRRT